MSFNLLFASVALNIGLTVSIVVGILIILFLGRLFLKRKAETINKWFVVFLYFLTFLLITTAIFFLLYMWIIIY